MQVQGDDGRRSRFIRGLRSLRAALGWVTKTELPEDQDEAPHERLRFWLALGIVLAAVSVAAAAWRAEIFTEYAAQKEALFRQDLAGQQLSERQDEETSASGLRQFSSYEQAALLANFLQVKADRLGSTLFAAQAQNERVLATSAVATDPALGNVLAGQERGLVRANPAGDYVFTVFGDGTLAIFDPTDRNAEAHTARADAVTTAAIAVVFALVVVLLTLSEIQLRRQPLTKGDRPLLGYGLAGTGAGLWLAGLIPLLVILFSDVPRLRS